MTPSKPVTARIIEKEIEGGNKLIATFMGLPLTKDRVMFTGGTEKEPFMTWRYHSDWNWLMDVVEKIEGYDDYRVTIFRRCCDIEKVYETDDAIIEITAAKTKIEATWLAVIALIKWFNSIKAESK